VGSKSRKQAAGYLPDAERLLDDPFETVSRRDDVLASRGAVNRSVVATRLFLASGPGSSIRAESDAAFAHNGLTSRPAFTFPGV
jgi:hypothetical protein